MAQLRAKIYTVSEINALVKAVLEQHLPGWLAVSGEISNWKQHRSSGHCYFSLKDEDAQLPCVMWSRNFRKLKFKPEDGLEVVGQGYIGLYSPQGRYQFYIESMQPAGVGALQLAFEQMVRKLRAEGLFEDAHKKPLPRYPQRIGIVTSESGAAVHDIADSISNRWPAVRLFLYPVPVQGEGAAAKIAAAIRQINRRNRALRLDVLIVGRGGGSMEDLWAFNEEVLARAIYDSRIPVISAVGHEVDVTVADLAADARASTPTKAGVIAVPDARQVLGQVGSLEDRLVGNVTGRVQLGRQNVETILASAVFRNPLLPVLNATQRLDETGGRLQQCAGAVVNELRQKLGRLYEQVLRIEPGRLLGRKAVQVNALDSSLVRATEAAVNGAKLKLTAAENRLGGLNPRKVLGRGYSITTNLRTGRIVTRPGDVQVEDALRTELAEKKFVESRVTKK